MSAHGPFSSEREALAAALELGGSGGAILSAAENRDMLIQAARAARVELGEYDVRILNWVASYEDATVAVIAGLIERAYQAGRAAS